MEKYDSFKKITSICEQIFSSRKTFTILRKGGFGDKILCILIGMVYLTSCLLLIMSCVNIINQKLFLVFYVLNIGILLLTMHLINRYFKRENKVYQKGMLSEEECLTFYIQNLEKSGIKKNLYQSIVNYYVNLQSYYYSVESNSIMTYINVLVIPVILNAVTSKMNNGKMYSLIATLLVGLFIVPGILTTVSMFKNQKKILYSKIVYYLQLALSIDEMNNQYSGNI